MEAAPFSGSAPRLTNVGMELPTGGVACLDATCSTGRMKGKNENSLIVVVLFIQGSQTYNSSSQGLDLISISDSVPIFVWSYCSGMNRSA